MSSYKRICISGSVADSFADFKRALASPDNYRDGPGQRWSVGGRIKFLPWASLRGLIFFVKGIFSSRKKVKACPALLRRSGYAQRRRQAFGDRWKAMLEDEKY